LWDDHWLFFLSRRGHVVLRNLNGSHWKLTSAWTVHTYFDMKTAMFQQ
jgi:hypothetical protein